MSKEVLKVDGMSCGHCKATVERELKNLNVQAEVNLEQKTVSVEYDESKVSRDDIKSNLKANGYEPLF